MFPPSRHKDVFLKIKLDFPGSVVDKNLPVNAGDKDSIPGPRRSQMSQSG